MSVHLCEGCSTPTEVDHDPGEYGIVLCPECERRIDEQIRVDEEREQRVMLEDDLMAYEYRDGSRIMLGPVDESRRIYSVQTDELMLWIAFGLLA